MHTPPPTHAQRIAIATGPQNKDRQPVHFETTGYGSLYPIFWGVSFNIVGRAVYEADNPLP